MILIFFQIFQESVIKCENLQNVICNKTDKAICNTPLFRNIYIYGLIIYIEQY